SSRRRHTRLVSDWSSDVCSSDLIRTMPTFDYDANAIVMKMIEKYSSAAKCYEIFPIEKLKLPLEEIWAPYFWPRQSFIFQENEPGINHPNGSSFFIERGTVSKLFINPSCAEQFLYFPMM